MTYVERETVADAIRIALIDLTCPEGWHPPNSECEGCATCNETIPMLKLAAETLERIRQRNAQPECPVGSVR